MMDSIFSIMGLFGRPAEAVVQQQVASPVAEEGRKRSREDEAVTRTPALITRRGSEVPSFREEDDIRPIKRFRSLSGLALRPPVVELKKTEERAKPLANLPEDVLANCLSFLNSTEDRAALQSTCKQFREISNSDEMMIGIQVGGDMTTGLHGIIQDDDTPDTAADKLMPFAMSGNLEAVYMLGIIQSYCQRDINNGVCMLKMASSQGYVRASYALGLVLRDSQSDEAAKYMKMAADAGYLPALQELLPAREMKAKYGEPNADELRRHLDHLCLNRMLSRHYVRNPGLRKLNTSHCWNPLCGRWAFKATVTPTGVRMHRPFVYRQPARTDENAVTARPSADLDFRVSRMKMCSRCCRAKYCSKLCQVYDWRSGRHKMECQFL